MAALLLEVIRKVVTLLARRFLISSYMCDLLVTNTRAPREFWMIWFNEPSSLIFYHPFV